MFMPPAWNASQRHAYLVRMLSGMEIDAFAQEIARLSLMLADYPSRNGWDLRQRDVFNAPDLSLSLSNASVVLCNPPFEQVPMEERPGYELQMPNQAAEILSRVLQASPALIGFVLPQAFRDGTQFRAVRRKLAETYGALDVIELPDRTFSHSDVGSTLFAEASWRRSWRSCNKFKSSATHGMDPDMSKIVPLFDPRKHEWDEHFRMDIDAFEIIGRGPSGRATVVRLRVNRPNSVLK